MGQGQDSAGAAKRRSLRRHLWNNVFREIHSLYSEQWEQSEASIIREMCEEQFDLPMGYGRVARTPEHLAWQVAVGSDDVYDAPVPDDPVHVTVVDGAELPPEKVAQLAAEVSKWENGGAADGTWKSAPDALIVKPSQKVVMRRRANTL